MKITDTHIHASQYPNVGLFGKSTLLDWLNTYTFPVESSFSSLTRARRVYNACVARTLSHGTTTASYFATIHVASTNLLADICLEKGQRAFIGRVCMDTDFQPPFLRDESAEQAMKDTIATITHIDSIDPHHTLIKPILTPRFALSCSTPLMSDLGALAKKTNLPIQTHLSENLAEIALVLEHFPNHDSYAGVYDAFSLLTPKTVLGHCVHLSPDERKLLKKRESKISHCPISNQSISSGLCPVRTYLDDGLDVGLGTDISGGSSTSILFVAREAAMVSRTIAALTPDDPKAPSTSAKDRKKLSVEECFYLATKGGAKCLGLESKVGAFDVGMEWDAQFVELDEAPHGPYEDQKSEVEEEADENENKNHHDSHSASSSTPSTNSGPVDLWGTETWGEKVAKWLFCGDDRNTKMVFVKGRLVHERI